MDSRYCTWQESIYYRFTTFPRTSPIANGKQGHYYKGKHQASIVNDVCRRDFDGTRKIIFTNKYDPTVLPCFDNGPLGEIKTDLFYKETYCALRKV